MLGKIYRWWLLVTLAVMLLCGMVLVASSYSEVGVTAEIGTSGHPLQLQDLAGIPQSVIDDASKVALSLFRNDRKEGSRFVSQTLAVYAEARDKDFVIVFNPGGWGEKLLENASGWQSIITGIQDELDYWGYKWVSLDYMRTEGNWGGRLGEAEEMMALYPDKGRILASRVEFLTRNIPGVRVILTGESTGSVITDAVMDILKNNLQVYSIQTGPPFWHKGTTRERALVLTNNGLMPDALSQGDFWTIIRGNMKGGFQFSEVAQDGGTIFNSLAAPGHIYWWQYPGVYSQITGFLEKNFGIKIGSVA
jgi:hypothetical protein